MAAEDKDEGKDTRHLIGITAVQKKNFYAGRVRVCADAAVAAGRNGQLILWWLANLLARQFNVVRQIEFDVPVTKMLGGIALFGHSPELTATLTETVALIAGKKVTVSTGTGGSVDVVLHVSPKCTGRDDSDYVVWGDGWKCAAATSLDVPAGDGLVAVGPILAATLGAAEAFQRITNWKEKGRDRRNALYLSAWEGQAAGDWAALADGPVIKDFSIEPFYLCGAGAVGQALAATLSYFEGRSGHAVVMDGDPLDETNLNRYCLSHLGSPKGKADVCKAILENDSFKVDAMPHYLKEYLDLAKPRTRSAALNAAEAKHQFRLILSCVDKNQARHSLQSMWPRLMFGGSTTGLTAKVSRYDCITGECLKCANPIPTDLTIEERADKLRKMTEADREMALAELAPEKAKAVRQYLDDPSCGHAAQEYLNELGEIQRREFSVGFVSVASGVFLAVALIQHALREGALVETPYNHFVFSFQSRMAGQHFFPREAACDCNGEGGQLYRDLWFGP